MLEEISQEPASYTAQIRPRGLESQIESKLQGLELLENKLYKIKSMEFPVAGATVFLELATFVGYFCVLAAVALFSFRRQKSDTDFLIGNRSLNFWLTALSAHASDMSSWLFLAYPAMVFMTGLSAAWAAIGLTVFMFLN